MMSPRITLPILSFAVLAMLGCGNGTGPESAVTLSFIGTPSGTSVTLRNSGPSLSRMAAGAPITDSQGNTLTITSAQVVLREIELEKVETVDCDSQLDEDGCEKFEAGPFLLDIPLDGATRQSVGINVPAGSYDEIEFEIHKISSGDQEDAAFAALHPEFSDQSIRVQGTFNGNAFTFESDLDVEQEFDLSPPLVVEENGASINVTVRLDLTVWFQDSAGNLIDPATANKGGLNEGIVKENIKQSVEAFEDDDRDGEDDDNS